MSAPKKPPLTEPEMVNRLRAKYSERAGNGIAYAFIPQVRSAAGFDARRTIDAYCMSLWPSRGLTLTAFECKSSRSDWQRELKKPDKAEEFCELADYFYVVVGAPDVVRPGELPETWGLMVPHGQGLKITVEAPRLRPAGDGHIKPFPPYFDRSFLAALMRAACNVGQVTPQQIAEAEHRAREDERARCDRTNLEYEAMYEGLRGQVQAFSREAGISITGTTWPDRRTAAEVGAAVRLVLEGEHNVKAATNTLSSIRGSAQRLIDTINTQIGEEAA